MAIQCAGDRITLLRPLLPKLDGKSSISYIEKLASAHCASEA